MEAKSSLLTDHRNHCAHSFLLFSCMSKKWKIKLGDWHVIENYVAWSMFDFHIPVNVLLNF